ncbi:dnaJ homolog subfamily C member 2-like [Physella acuta]|uniref:dnaJ homolog subfamily C member 2-like n=1 Tax=Physella acuta TaxID=109671 RepID=UPI0027DD46B5|nr:dnaJ homolog subfamily C member 2-like [Physella acuta]
MNGTSCIQMKIIPDSNDVTTVFGSISTLLSLDFEPVGRWFEAHHRRAHSIHSHSHHSLDSSSSESEEEEEEDQFDEEDESLLLRLDPKEWKKQDHYAVLGLSKLRYRASEDQLKRAYKQKVLTHHPDKRKARGKVVKEGDDDYFTCITKAYEILGNKQKRRSFDSVDPEFDEDIPPVVKDKFFEVFRPAFERNARWSTKKRVPRLGDENTPFEEVNSFYSFWYEFDSWREFSYLDEEEKEKGENREERRWIEKQNKAARQKLKKEEMVRIRQLVDNAYASDPRIIKFREDEKERKNAVKRAKQEAARQRVEEEERRRQEILEEERKKKEKEEEEAKAQAVIARKEKEALKKQFKKERKALRAYMKEYDYFATNDEERVLMMKEVDRIAEVLSLINLQTLNESLSKGINGAKDAFMGKLKEVNDQMEEEKRRYFELTSQKSANENTNVRKVWSELETQILIKAVNLFPAGTQDRWEVIANFISQHVTGSNKNAKDVLSKAKELQKSDLKLREEVKKNAFAQFEQSHRAAKSGDMEKPSERLESVGEQQVRETGSNQAPWTAEEQKLLEQALKSYPASETDRWDKISAVIPSRSKKDCMKRYKELCELVKAKKNAQTAVASKNKKL